MAVWWVAVAAVLGAAAISFVQLAVDRAGRGVEPSRLRGRSRCPRCSVVLRVRELLPVAGYVLLRGRCAACRAPIPRRHLYGEFAVAAMCAAAVDVLGADWWLPVVLVLPPAALLLGAPAVRAAGPRWWAAAALPPAGVAVLTLGVGWVAQGRGGLYALCGLLGVLALGSGALLTRPTVRTGGAPGVP